MRFPGRRSRAGQFAPILASVRRNTWPSGRRATKEEGCGGSGRLPKLRRQSGPDPSPSRRRRAPPVPSRGGLLPALGNRFHLFRIRHSHCRTHRRQNLIKPNGPIAHLGLHAQRGLLILDNNSFMVALIGFPSVHCPAVISGSLSQRLSASASTLSRAAPECKRTSNSSVV